MNYSIFIVEGGLGKNVAATAVARCIKNNFPDRELIVVCSYPRSVPAPSICASGISNRVYSLFLSGIH